MQTAVRCPDNLWKNWETCSAWFEEHHAAIRHRSPAHRWAPSHTARESLRLLQEDLLGHKQPHNSFLSQPSSTSLCDVHAPVKCDELKTSWLSPGYLGPFWVLVNFWILMENTDLQWFIWGNCNSHIRRGIQEENTGDSPCTAPSRYNTATYIGTEGPSQLFQAVFSKCVGVGQADPPLFPLRLLPSFPFKHSVTRKVLSCLQGCPLGKPEVEGKASEWIRNGTNCSAGVAGQEYTSHTFLRLQVWNQPLSNETKMLGNSLRSAFFSRCELVQFRSTCSYTHVSLGDHLEMVNIVLYH